MEKFMEGLIGMLKFPITIVSEFDMEGFGVLVGATILTAIIYGLVRLSVEFFP